MRECDRLGGFAYGNPPPKMLPNGGIGNAHSERDPPSGCVPDPIPRTSWLVGHLRKLKRMQVAVAPLSLEGTPDQQVRFLPPPQRRHGSRDRTAWRGI